MKTKKTLLRIGSLLLAAACVLCLFYCWRGFEQSMAAKSYWEETREEALASFDLLEDGVRQLKANESAYTEGVEACIAGEKELEEGEEALAAGKEKLHAGEGQLADGLKRLGEYEDGEKQVAEGLELVLAAETYYNAAGEPLLTSIAGRLGEGFSYWTLDEDGHYVFLNGEPFLDLDKALLAVQAGRDFVADTTDLVTAEITARVELLQLTAALSALGLLSALFGLFARRIGAMVFALPAAAASGAAIAFSLLDGVEYPLCAIAGENAPPLPGLDLRLALYCAAFCALLQLLLTIVLRWKRAEKPAAAQEPVVTPPPAEPIITPAPAFDEADELDAMSQAFAAFLQTEAFREALRNAGKDEDEHNKESQ